MFVTFFISRKGWKGLGWFAWKQQRKGWIFNDNFFIFYQKRKLQNRQSKKKVWFQFVAKEMTKFSLLSGPTNQMEFSSTINFWCSLYLRFNFFQILDQHVKLFELFFTLPNYPFLSVETVETVFISVWKTINQHRYINALTFSSLVIKRREKKTNIAY